LDCSVPLLYLPSFPTRRSSDLVVFEAPLKSESVFLMIFNRQRRQNIIAPHLTECICIDVQVVEDFITGFLKDIILAKFSHIHIQDRKSTRLNSSHVSISYAVFC